MTVFMKMEMLPDIRIELSHTDSRTVSIVQETGSEEPAVVYVHKDQVQAVIKALKTFLKSVPT